MSILCYHTVDDEFRSRLSLTPAQFDEHCRWLAADRDVVPLDTAVSLLDARGRLPRGTVALTFDDGLEGVYRHVYPTLIRHGLPATVFMVTGTLTGDHPHVDWIDGTPPGVLRTVSADQMQEMARDGIDFGSHSSRHLDLPSLEGAACEEDLRRSRVVMEELLGTPVGTLAYPRGRHSAEVRRAARRAGFQHAFSLPEGREPVTDLALPRAGVYAHNHLPTVRIKAARNYLPVRMGPAYPLVRSVVSAARRVVGSEPV
jgi:peptidoglycan/xylan/chitin deacetylase (PgdA/CDA1 family)